MGLFTKKNKKEKAQTEDAVEPDKKNKKKKQPKPVKKGKTLIDRMGLDEAVASMGLVVLKEAADSSDSAVRELEKGYTVVVVTNKMLEDQNVSYKDEAFGSFAQHLKSDHIHSLLLRKDLERGLITLIPDSDMISLMNEFSFGRSIEYQWAYVPYNCTDDSEVLLIDSFVTLGQLTTIAYDHLTLVAVDNGLYIEGTEPHTEAIDNVSVDENQEELDVSISDSNDVSETIDFDVIDDDDLDSVDVYNNEDIIDDSLLDNHVDFDDTLSYDESDIYDSGDVFSNDVSESSVMVDVPLVEAEEAVQSIMNTRFYNDELDLAVDMQRFDSQFAQSDDTVILFDEDPIDDSDLSLILSQKRKDANVELLKLHRDHMMLLRSRYQIEMQSAYDQLVKELDMTNNDTKFGAKREEIELEREVDEKALDTHIAEARTRMDVEYNERRERSGQIAYDNAVRQFDELYRSAHERDKAEVGGDKVIKNEIHYDRAIAELNETRRLMARQMFDRVTTDILVALQNEFKKLHTKELSVYEAFRRDIDAFMKEHYSDEVMRVKALAEHDRQMQEADKVRREYEEIVAQKDSQLVEMMKQSEFELEQISLRNESLVEDVTESYEMKLLEAREEREQLLENIKELNDDIRQVEDKKHREFEYRTKSMQDVIDGLKLQLDYEDDSAQKRSRVNMIIVACVSLTMLAAGVVGGFLFGAYRVANMNQPSIRIEEKLIKKSKESTDDKTESSKSKESSEIKEDKK